MAVPSLLTRLGLLRQAEILEPFEPDFKTEAQRQSNP